VDDCDPSSYFSPQWGKRKRKRKNFLLKESCYNGIRKNLNSSPIPCSRVLLEKLKVHCCVHKSPPLNSMRSS
jgi:hypothetical protein